MTRPRLSEARKSIQGTARPDRRHNPAPAESLATCPPAPDDLGEVARREWERLAPVAHALGVLSAADLPAFKLLCETWATIRTAQGVLDHEGLTLETGSGSRRAHPAARILEVARAQAARLLAEFAMTPRGRAHVDVPEPAGDDEFARTFLGGAK